MTLIFYRKGTKVSQRTVVRQPFVVKNDKKAVKKMIGQRRS
jgi:hypothetical protein